MRVRPSVTVVVATHDRPQLLPDCVAAIAADLGPGDQLLVIESGDSRAREAVAGLPGRVEVVSSHRKEKTAKLNEAMKVAASEVLLSTDDDCRVPPGWVDAMAAPFEDPSVGAVFGPVVGLSHAPSDTPGAHFPPGPGPQELWAFAHGAAMGVLRAAVIEAGGFDERFGPGGSRQTTGEEGDLLLRMREKKWLGVVADAPAVGHLDWRTAAEDAANVLAYEQGAGAYLGAALRRAPRATAKLFVLRLFYQAELWGERDLRGRWFGPRTTVEFLRGVGRGLRIRPQRWV